MAMGVHHALARNSADIKPDIIPGWLLCSLDHLPALSGQGHYRTFFIKGQAEKIRFVAERDHQHVSCGYREPVLPGVT
jgi:hypothetical protein